MAPGVDAEWEAIRSIPAPPPVSPVRSASAAVVEVQRDAPSPPRLPPMPVAPQRVSQRAIRKRPRFGDAGELDGAASSFHSAPLPRKASVSPSQEMGVPAHALPGSEVLAMGLHAGTRKRFRATVLKLRRMFPRSARRAAHNPADHRRASILMKHAWFDMRAWPQSSCSTSPTRVATRIRWRFLTPSPPI